MKSESAYQDQPAYQALSRFFDAYLTRRDVEATLSLVTEDVYSLGTGEHELARNKEELRQLLIEEIEGAPDPIEMKLSDYRERTLAPGVYDCQCRAESKIRISEEEYIIFPTRLTACFRTEEDGVVRACSFHMSSSNQEQEEGDYFPLHYGTKAEHSISEESKLKLQSLLNESIPGGIMGGYLEEDFPLYIINDNLLKMLGYDTYEEFRECTEEKMIRTIYKEDREKVKKRVHSMMEPGNKYEIEYRIIRKDGSVFWCHDVGQIIQAEDGRKAIISVIIDISERIAYQELMDQLRESGNRDSILYYTANVTTGEMLHGRELFGSSKEGHEGILREFILNCVHPEDGKTFWDMIGEPGFYEKRLREQPRFEIRLRVDVRAMTEMIYLSEEVRRHLESTGQQWAWTLFQGVLIRDQRGDIWIQVALRDISAEMKERDEMHRSAESHPLTGLLNRRAWDRKVRQRLQKGCTGTLIMMDIDYFKDVNDNLGHLEGDLVLKETAQILSNTFRGDDLIGHIGGDEFCVFAYSLTEFESIQSRMEQILDQRRKFYRGKDGKTRKISLSIGIAAVEPEAGRNLEHLISCADRALYQAKEAGRDCWRLYVPDRF